jgi:hypothetical protein
MNAKQQHQQAMDYSFKAKQAAFENNHNKAFELFCKAAELESEVANFILINPNLNQHEVY